MHLDKVLDEVLMQSFVLRFVCIVSTAMILLSRQ